MRPMNASTGYRLEPHPEPPIRADEMESDELDESVIAIVETLLKQLEDAGIKPRLDEFDSAVLYEKTRRVPHRTVLNRYGFMERKPCPFLKHPKPKGNP